jgi:hypothetical protein
MALGSQSVTYRLPTKWLCGGLGVALGGFGPNGFDRPGTSPIIFVGFRFGRVLLCVQAMTDDGQLLQQYTRDRSEAAFGELVKRHIDVVYSAALRVAGGDSHLAQDVTQTVFLDLPRKAQSLPPDAILAGWLYRHAWFTAAKMVRTERRRQIREQTAMEMRALDHNTGSGNRPRVSHSRRTARQASGGTIPPIPRRQVVPQIPRVNLATAFA